MTLSHSSMKPQQIIADRVGSLAAKAVLADLNKCGLIIVEKGAIGRAQREAVAVERERAGNERMAA